MDWKSLDLILFSAKYDYRTFQHFPPKQIKGDGNIYFSSILTNFFKDTFFYFNNLKDEKTYMRNIFLFIELL